jgi:hypothetical protein
VENCQKQEGVALMKRYPKDRLKKTTRFRPNGKSWGAKPNAKLVWLFKQYLSLAILIYCESFSRLRQIGKHAKRR